MILTCEGLQMDPDKIKAIKDWKDLRTIKDVRDVKDVVERCMD
jgi:hypothetical protein